MSFLRKLLSRRQALRLYWVTNDIAISRAPHSVDWSSIRQAGVRHVFDLRAETEDRRLEVESAGCGYTRLPVEDYGAPPDDDLIALTKSIIERISTEGPVLIHCREGRGRSALVACATLVQLGIPPADAYATLRRARPDVSLTDAQSAALDRFVSLRRGR